MRSAPSRLGELEKHPETLPRCPSGLWDPSPEVLPPEAASPTEGLPVCVWPGRRTLAPGGFPGLKGHPDASVFSLRDPPSKQHSEAMTCLCSWRPPGPSMTGKEGRWQLSVSIPAANTGVSRLPRSSISSICTAAAWGGARARGHMPCLEGQRGASPPPGMPPSLPLGAAPGFLLLPPFA